MASVGVIDGAINISNCFVEKGDPLARSAVFLYKAAPVGIRRYFLDTGRGVLLQLFTDLLWPPTTNEPTGGEERPSSPN